VSDRPAFQQVLLDEIAGKNAAVHAYDRILWTIRSGFVTVLFVGWGFILRSLAESAQPRVRPGVATAMLIASAGLAVTAFIVDIHYARRKFRVIADLNELLAYTVRYATSLLPDRPEVPAPESLLQVLCVSGESDDDRFRGAGYTRAARISAVVYGVPPTFILAGLLALLAVEGSR